MKNLAFDLDGVLFPWQEVAFDYCSEYFKKDFDYNTFYTKTIKEFGTVFVDNLVRIETIYTSRSISKDLKNLVNKLAENNDIFYITKRPECVRVTTEIWMQREGFPCRNNLYLSKDKSIDVRALEIDIMVEDRAEEANLLKNFCKVFLINKPYNINIPTDGVERINNILELEEIFYGIKSS